MSRKDYEKLLKEKGREIKKLKKEKNKYKKLSLLDDLTEVFNSRMLEMESRRFSREKGYVCVLFTDIDNFGKINDDLGHRTGDLILKKFARTLLSFFRRDGELVIRKSGGSDEFICIWIANNKRKTEQFIKELRKSFSEIPLRKNSRKTFSVSAGFSCGKSTEISLQSLLEKADEDMYAEKIRRKRS
jgi:diguanylate cyclase (GGDEF)-like protein